MEVPGETDRKRITLPQPCLMLVTEPHPELVEIVDQAVAGGVNIVQWRSKNLENAIDELWELEEKIEGRALLIINTWAILVRKVNADGVHLPENSIWPDHGAKNFIPWSLAGRSVHSVESARTAMQNGADYLVAGTIFASHSHPGIAPQGLSYLEEVCSAVSIPVVAIGGIRPDRVDACLAAGAAGVAVLSPIMRADHPEAVAREYWQALKASWK